MLPNMGGLCGNPSSLYAFSQRAREALEDARVSLGCEADNQTICSTAFEHHAVLHALKKLEVEGFSVTLLDVHEDGLVTPEQVREAIRSDTCLVTVMYANNEIGMVEPIREIAAIRDAGVIKNAGGVDSSAAAYKNGRTPSPCIDCSRKVHGS